MIPRPYGRKPERANIAPDTGQLGQSEEKTGRLNKCVARDFETPFRSL